MLKESCPINKQTIDENVARLNGFFTILLLLTGYFVKPLIYLFLTLDFALRIYKVKLSPVARLSKFLLNLLHIKPIPTNRAPKRFAAKIGLVMSLLLLVFWASSHNQALLITLLFFLTAASLESFFNYCVGCKIYSLLSSARIINTKK